MTISVGQSLTFPSQSHTCGNANWRFYSNKVGGGSTLSEKPRRGLNRAYQKSKLKVFFRPFILTVHYFSFLKGQSHKKVFDFEKSQELKGRS
jgi:hypothetical protein